MTAKSGTVQSLQARVVELETRLARAEATTRALREVGLALGSTLDLDQLLELILGKIAELLDADRATLYLLDETRGRLLSRIIIGDESRSIELAVGEGVAGFVAQHGRTLRVKDAYRDKRFDPSWDHLTGYRTRSILAAPMKNHVGRTIGVIQVLNKKSPGGPDEFSAHDEELLTALSTQAAVSIDNSRLFLSVIQKNMQLVETKEQLEHRVSDLKLLFDLESAMGRADTLEDLAQAVITRAARTCGAEAGGLLIDEGEAGVWLYFIDVTRGDVEPDVKRVAVRRGEGIIGVSMVQNIAMSIPRHSEVASGDEEPVSARLGQVLGITVRTAIAVPLEGEGEAAIGAMALYNSARPTGFTQDARALLRLVSANASTALRLFQSRIEHERSERLTSIGRLLSGVMHDIRTPLTVISGYVQLMAQADQTSVRDEYAKHILGQFDAIGAMQREVLEFARGEKSILLRKVYLTKYFSEVQKQLERELEGTDVKLVFDVEDRGTARFDEAKMTRVVHNLARNAIDAMSETGGTLTVHVYRDGKDLVLRFEDQGRGIPKEIEGRLFQSFVTAGKKTGTGLGLAIVKKIVDEHGGRIQVKSSDGGATFTIWIPQEGPLPQQKGLEPKAESAKVPAPATKRASARPPAKTITPVAKSEGAATAAKKPRNNPSAKA